MRDKERKSTKRPGKRRLASFTVKPRLSLSGITEVASLGNTTYSSCMNWRLIAENKDWSEVFRNIKTKVTGKKMK